MQPTSVITTTQVRRAEAADLLDLRAILCVAVVDIEQLSWAEETSRQHLESSR